MQIEFLNKKQSKKKQEEAFLSLKPEERMLSFFVMLKQMRSFPTKKNYDTKDNFVIEINTENDRKSR